MTWTDPRADGPPEPRRHRRTPQTRLRWATGIGAALLIIGAAAVLLLQAGSSPSTTSKSTARPAPATVTHPSLHMEGGVLVGFPRTSAGARSAAVNIVAALGSELMFQPDRRAMLTAIADPAARPALEAHADAASAAAAVAFGLGPDGKSLHIGWLFVSRTLPADTQVAGWTPDSSVVQVWADGLAGIAGTGSTVPVQSAWETQTITLHWSDNRWRYSALTGTPGPVPLVGAQAPSTSVDIATTISTFGALTYG